MSSSTTLERKGVKWTEQEDKDLLKEYLEQKKSIEDISKIHKRTVNGIRARLIQHSLDMMNEKKLTYENVSKIMNISIEEIRKFEMRHPKSTVPNKVDIPFSKFIKEDDWQFSFLKDILNSEIKIEGVHWYTISVDKIEIYKIFKYLHKKYDRDWVIIKDPDNIDVPKLLKNKLEEEDENDEK
jgi:hypothetical protein